VADTESSTNSARISYSKIVFDTFPLTESSLLALLKLQSDIDIEPISEPFQLKSLLDEPVVEEVLVVVDELLLVEVVDVLLVLEVLLAVVAVAEVLLVAAVVAVLAVAAVLLVDEVVVAVVFSVSFLHPIYTITSNIIRKNRK